MAYWIFSKPFCAAISKHSHEIIRGRVPGFWTAEYSPVLQLKSDSTRNNILKFLKMKLSPRKILWCNLILVAIYNISKNRLVHRRFSSVYWKVSWSKHVVTIFNFSKKDPTTRFALSRSLKKRSQSAVSCWRRSIPLLTPRKCIVLESLCSKFLVYFSNSAVDFIYIAVLSTKKH